MTLGGLALAIGLLVDNATVDDREHPSQPDARQAADGRDPGRLGRGDPAADRRHAGDLHRVLPGGAAVRRGALPVHSAGRSPSCSACWRPTCCRSPWCRRSPAFCWPAHNDHDADRAASSACSTAASSASAAATAACWSGALRHRAVRAGLFAGCCWCVTGALATMIGTRFLPQRRCRASSSCISAPRPAPGSRTPKSWCCRWRIASARSFPPQELDTINDNVGVPSSFNLAFVPSDNVGGMDAEILISLKPGHHPTIDYIRAIRANLPSRVPRQPVLFPDRRHRQPGAELRPVRADRHPDPGRQLRPRVRPGPASCCRR